MNTRPTADILYHVTLIEASFFGNSDRGCRWLQTHTENNPHIISRQYLKDFLEALDEDCITHEATYRVPEL